MIPQSPPNSLCTWVDAQRAAVPNENIHESHSRAFTIGSWGNLDDMARRRSSKSEARPVAPSIAQAARSSRNLKPVLEHLAMSAGFCLLILLAWSDSFGGGFPFDNRALILHDSRIQQATGTNLGLIFNHSYWWPIFESGLYRPVTTLSYLFNFAILGNRDHPDGYHWINLLLHSLNVFLVYLLGLRLIRKMWPAAFIAAIWAVHPVLTESVTNIIGRADLLAGVALLSGVLMYLKSTDSTGWRRLAWLAGLAAVTGLGVFSKESAVSIPGVILLYELAWWNERKQLRGLLLGCAALAPPVLFMCYQRFVVLAASDPPLLRFVDNPLLNASFIRARLTAITVIAKYLWLLVWPLNLSCDYSYNQIPLANGNFQNWVAWLLVLGVLIAAVAMFKRSRVAFFFIGFAFVCIVPVSNFFFFTGTIMAERFLYLPAIGFAVCLVLTAYWIGRRFQFPRFASTALCLIIVAFGIRTWERNLDWRDDIALWTAEVHSAPDSYKGHDNLAYSLNESGATSSNIDQIISEAEKSIAILDPVTNSLNTESTFANAGAYYVTKGDLLSPPEADGHATTTPGSVSAYRRSLEILLRGASIDKESSERHRREELGHRKPDPEMVRTGSFALYYALAVTYLRLGEYQDAYNAAAYTRLLSPQYANAYQVMTESLLLANRNEDAAVSSIEGLLITADPRLFPLVQKAYNTGLDSKDCAFIQTPGGLSFNFSCEIVHNDICKASSEVIKVLSQNQLSAAADEFKRKALVGYRCSPSLLQ